MAVLFLAENRKKNRFLAQEDKMRYKDTGELHRDFHLSTNGTISYVLEKYGEDFLRELFRRTAQFVYKDIYQHLKQGDTGALLEHWNYYFYREGGDFSLTEDADGITFHEKKCPAASYIIQREGKVPETFFLQVTLLNEGWSENTPFSIETQILGDTEYIMTVRRKHTP